MCFDDGGDDRMDAGGANDAASGAEKANNKDWNFMTDRAVRADSCNTRMKRIDTGSRDSARAWYWWSRE